MINFDEYVDNLYDVIVSSTQEIIQIPSVKSDPLPGRPFGEAVDSSLEYMLALGQSMGFTVKNIDGYVGYIEYGEGNELVGILAHLDVVPEGTGWTYPPFAGEIHEGKIYGRGAIDNKGPAVAALYAMKAIKDSEQTLNKRVRLILGLDEESGWACMHRYKQTEEIPQCAFTPDADYPVIHAEKGIVDYTFTKHVHPQNSAVKILYVKGGNRPNMVPDFCEAALEVDAPKIDDITRVLQEKIQQFGFNINVNSENNRIILASHGKSSHGSTPEKGMNAISHMMVVLYECLKTVNITNNFIQFYNEYIGLEVSGQSIGCGVEDDVSGKLTFNVGLIEMDDDGNCSMTVNIRYPVTYKEQDIRSRITNTIQKYELTVEVTGGSKPLYMPKDHPLVQKLMTVYQEVTGDTLEPLAIGGGTYARAMDNAVAFGALFPNEPELAHEKDEYISIASLIKNTKIFARAIHELTI